MELMDFTVQKKNLSASEEGTQDEIQKKSAAPAKEAQITFKSTDEGVREGLSAAGKALLLSDGDGVFADASLSPRTISLVFDGDCLPLFSMPDGVSRILASGDGKVLRAARYFAEIRGIGCVLFPKDASLSGALEPSGEVLLAGETARVPLREAEIICDEERLKRSLGGAYGFLLLSKLADVENRALAQFHREERPSLPVGETGDLSCQAIVRACARQRMGEQTGEAYILSELLRAAGEKYPHWRAFVQLSALYAAFFERGKPRRYFTPDYRGRAERAGTVVAGIPSPEEYVVRALTLERIRAPFAKELLKLIDEKLVYLKAISTLEGELLPLKAGDLSALSALPEHAPNGLTAIIRDFGLMDWSI